MVSYLDGFSIKGINTILVWGVRCKVLVSSAAGGGPSLPRCVLLTVNWPDINFVWGS